MAEVLEVLLRNPVVLVFLLIIISILVGILIIVCLTAMKAVWQGKEVEIWKIKITGRKTSPEKPGDIPTGDEVKSEETDEECAIEGYWGDWSGSLEDLRASIVHIRCDKEGYAIDGKEFDENYQQTGHWASDVAKFRRQKRRLEYLFEATGLFTGGETTNATGYTTISFFGDSKKRPERYSGTFVDVINPATGKLRSDSFDGKRLTEQEVRYHLDTQETNQALIDKLIMNAKKRAQAILDAKNKAKAKAEV